MNHSLKPKRNHHILPKLYLKGFIEAPNKPFTWVYKRAKPYHPGTKSHHNPQKQPIRNAGAERDHYAFRNRDGSINYDKYENELEQLEKPSDKIFRKLRNHKMITKQEKLVFAKYIFHMFKRVPKRIERFKEKWPELYNSISSDVIEWLDFEEAITSKDESLRLKNLKSIRNEAKDILAFFRENFLDSELPLRAMALESPSNIPEILSSMTWQFYLAPTGNEYVTGDEPIFNPGLDKLYTEVSFPISKDVVLIMSWYDIEEGFFSATSEIVTEINQRTSNQAQKLYSSSPQSWIVDLFNEKRKGYYLIYPYSADMFES